MIGRCLLCSQVRRGRSSGWSARAAHDLGTLHLRGHLRADQRAREAGPGAQVRFPCHGRLARCLARASPRDSSRKSANGCHVAGSLSRRDVTERTNTKHHEAHWTGFEPKTQDQNLVQCASWCFVLVVFCYFFLASCLSSWGAPEQQTGQARGGRLCWSWVQLPDRCFGVLALVWFCVFICLFWSWVQIPPSAQCASCSDERNLPRAAVFLGGYGRFAAVTAEAFAASRRSWRRSLPLRGGHGGGLFYTDTKTTQKNASHATSAFFITGTCLGFAPLRGTCAARRNFRRNRRKQTKKSPKKPPPLAVGGGHVAVFAAPPWRSRRSFVDTAGGLSWRSFLFFQFGG